MSQYLALVVDDEPDICELLEITLSRMNVGCHTAGSVREATALLARNRYNLCLTDMRLPDGNGLQLVSLIQRDHPDTPAAVITAHGNVESAVQALKAGAFDFISKPVDLQALRNLVTSALKVKAPTKTPERRSRLTLLGNSDVMANTRTTIAIKGF